MKKYRSVLVTGGAGFIGSHLAEALVENAYHVTIVDNLSTGALENIREIADRVEFYPMDIRRRRFASFVAERNFDIIFHWAANAYVPPSVEDPTFDYEINLRGPFRLLETLRRADQHPILIAASSAAVYGNPRSVPIHEDMPTLPISPYGVSKLATERYIAVFSHLYHLRAASLRLFSVYGPRQHKQIVYDFIRKLSTNPHELEILGDGTQVRDMVYVTDVVQAALVVLDNGALCGETYNVATGQGHTTCDIADAVSRAMNLDPQRRFTGSVRPGDCERWVASIDRIRAAGYAPTVTLAEGAAQTAAWYQSTVVPV